MTTRILIPNGVVGLGFDPVALQRGLSLKPDAICVDGGSTDSGPFYLGTGTSKYSRASTKSEWRELMKARFEARIPLVVGSAGTCGTDSTVDWMFEITKELADELGQKIRVARVYSSQSAREITSALTESRLIPLEPEQEICSKTIEECRNIVALAGAEQIINALEKGADIVLAGRTTDTAVIAALPIMRGENVGASWHGAKIGECGALCSSNPTSGVIVVEFDKSGFTVEAMAEGAVCTPKSVSAHMLYENADPFVLHEPGGYLDVKDARYEAVDERRVRVTGSKWHKAPNYNVKLEGARIGGFQTTILSILREQRYVENARLWVEKLHKFLTAEIKERMDLDECNFELDFRLVGMNATLGELEMKNSHPVEVGLLCIVTTNSQELSNEIAKLINPFILHYPLTDDEPQATFAFPYSPAESERGALYEFVLNHVLELEEPLSAFRVQIEEVGCGGTR